MRKMFHVEHSECAASARICSTWNKLSPILALQVLACGLPDKILLFTVPGIGTCTQRQPGICVVFSASSAPNQRMTRPSLDRMLRDHDKRSPIPPKPGAVTIASPFVGIFEASKRTGRTSTLLSCSFRATSFRKAHFFLFGSSNVTLQFGHRSLIAKPGKPAPEPTSASRPFAKFSRDNAKMLSPKWNRTMSSSFEIVVRAIFFPHIESKSMYD